MISQEDVRAADEDLASRIWFVLGCIMHLGDVSEFHLARDFRGADRACA